MAFEPADEYLSYDDVPFYRKRWFFALSILFCIPVGLIVGLSGEVYASQDGKVMKFPQNQRIMLCVGFGLLMLVNGLRAFTM